MIQQSLATKAVGQAELEHRPRHNSRDTCHGVPSPFTDQPLFLDEQTGSPTELENAASIANNDLESTENVLRSLFDDDEGIWQGSSDSTGLVPQSEKLTPPNAREAAGVTVEADSKAAPVPPRELVDSPPRGPQNVEHTAGMSVETTKLETRTLEPSTGPRADRSRRASLPAISMEKRLESSKGANTQLPETLNRSGLIPLLFKNIIGDRGMRPNDPGRFPENKSRKEDISDVYGTLIMERERRARVSVQFRGLVRPVCQLLLTIKKPPREVHVIIESLWSLEQYRARFHDEGSKGPFHVMILADWYLVPGAVLWCRTYSPASVPRRLCQGNRRCYAA